MTLEQLAKVQELVILTTGAKIDAGSKIGNQNKMIVETYAAKMHKS